MIYKDHNIQERKDALINAFMMHKSISFFKKGRAAKEEQADSYEYDDILHGPGPSLGARPRIKYISRAKRHHKGYVNCKEAADWHHRNASEAAVVTLSASERHSWILSWPTLFGVILQNIWAHHGVQYSTWELAVRSCEKLPVCANKMWLPKFHAPDSGQLWQYF